LTPGSANDSFYKVGNYDVKEDKKIHAYFNTFSPAMIEVLLHVLVMICATKH